MVQGAGECLVFQLVCCFYRYWAYNQSQQSSPRWNPAFKMEPVLSDSSFSFTRAETAVKLGGGCLTFTQTGMIKQVCRSWAIAKSRTRVSEISSSS